MGVIIRNGIEYSGAGGIGGGGCDCGEIIYLTQEEYDALPPSKEEDNIEYRITNAGTHVNAARDWAYDNSESGLEAKTVQDAIDEVADGLTVKYDNKTDCIQVLNNGSWVDIIKANAKSYKLYAYGSYYNGQSLSSRYIEDGSYTDKISYINMISPTRSNCYYGFTERIDLTNYNKIKIGYSLKEYDTNVPTTNCFVGFSTASPTHDVRNLELPDATDSKAEIVISALTGSYYINFLIWNKDFKLYYIELE